MGLRCWNGAACSRDCIKPCRPAATLDQAETIRAMAPTNQFFDDGDPRRVLIDRAMSPAAVNWRRLLKAYMAAVVRWEGVTFVDCISTDDLTEAERIAILEVEAELKRENPRAHL